MRHATESQQALNEMKTSRIHQLHLVKIPKGMQTEFLHDIKEILNFKLKHHTNKKYFRVIRVDVLT